MQSDPGGDEVVVRQTANPRLAAEWELVLTAAAIESRVYVDQQRWRVAVSADDRARAEQALEAYDDDAPPLPPSPEPLLEYGPGYAGVLSAVGLLVFHAWLAVHDRDQAWFWHGNASAARILRGEGWRLVTALTLHADVVHAASNALFLALFASALCRAVGPGVGLWLILVSGVAGNLLDAVWRGPPNIAVGASTAVFGAVGGLGGLRFMSRYRIAASRQRAWVALAATVALLAMLGSAPGTDILAHLFGLIAGIGLGIGVAIKLAQPPGRIAQATLASAALALVVLCWWAAWRG